LTAAEPVFLSTSLKSPSSLGLRTLTIALDDKCSLASFITLPVIDEAPSLSEAIIILLALSGS